MSVTDSRDLGSSDQLVNRRLFIDRYKELIKQKINHKLKDRGIKDIYKDGDVSSDADTITIDKLDLDGELSSDVDTITIDKLDLNDERVYPGNVVFNPGDIVEQESGDGRGQDSGSGDGDGEDDFIFTLTKEEILELYFEGLELPDLVKRSLLKCNEYIFKTAGYSKEGIPPRLSIKKTFENATARKIANRRDDDEETGRKSPFLDEVDLRYIRKELVPVPCTNAVMICLMDVSGSMGFHEKLLAKKFYLFLYLFLTKFYKDIEIVFVRYHSKPDEVDEELFFYSRETGGTSVIPALDYVKKLITRYNINSTNLYLAWASDGDWGMDESKASILEAFFPLRDLMQYTVYLQCRTVRSYANLYTALHGLERVGTAVAEEEKEIYPAFVELFKKRGIKK